MGDLREYRAKRDASRTPEPVPPAAARRRRKRAGGAPIFVVQEHHASALHWDFRLEHDGVLVSWALPRGVPKDPRRNHRAVRTEDHPVEYADFHGEIPKGEYGAGIVALFDRGTYVPLLWTDDEVKVDLAGERLTGRFSLFRTKQDWMIHREKGQDAEGLEPPPSGLAPMLAVVGPMPDAPGWAAEFKWDGMRVLATIDGGRLGLRSRNGLDVTGWFPELRTLSQTVGTTSMLLDGEVIAFADGRVSFSAVAGRFGASEGKAAKLSASTPAVFMIFDLLHLDGRSLLDLPYTARRELLEGLDLAGPNWQTPPSYAETEAGTILEAARAQGLEGIIAKRADSRYSPRARSPDWRKIKFVSSQTVVIGGWTELRTDPPDPSRIGAPLVGVVDDGGALVYAGKVGTGFSDAVRRDLRRALSTIGRGDSPFAGTVPRAEAAGATWTEPLLLAEVTFTEWTPNGRLRHPSFKGLRTDKQAGEATRESQS